MPAAKRKKKIKRTGGIDMTLFSILMIMIAFGLIMVFSASSPSAFYQQNDQFYYIKKQLMWTAIGFVVMMIVSGIDYKNIKKWSGTFYIAAVCMMILVPIAGVEINGAKRWLGFGSLTFQPSEVSKLALIFYVANRISKMPQGGVRRFRNGYLPCVSALGVIEVLMMVQRHLSAMIVTFAVIMIVLYAAGAKIKHIVGTVLLAGFGFVALTMFTSFRTDRIMAFMDPFGLKMKEGWQIVQGLYAIASGGLFGRGLGQSRQKFLYVPEAHNDYIYAILCEELGFIGAIAVALLFAALITRCIIIAMRAPDTFSKLTVFGITALIAMQYVINIGVVTSTFPNTGMQLPFFSAGGSSLVFMMAAMGVVLNISKYTKKDDELT